MRYVRDPESHVIRGTRLTRVEQPVFKRGGNFFSSIVDVVNPINRVKALERTGMDVLKQLKLKTGNGIVRI